MKTTMTGPVIGPMLLMLLFSSLFSACQKDSMNDLFGTENPQPSSTPAFTDGQTILASVSDSDGPVLDNRLCELSPISRADITPETPVTELEDGSGFQISSGIVKIKIDNREVRLKGLTATFRFCENDRLIAVEGSAAIPSPIECISFGESAGTEIGFFTGKYVNDHQDRYRLDFALPDDRAYFVFSVRTRLGVDICTNADNPGERPLSVEIPGTSTDFLFITDFSDPFYYLRLPKFAIAESANAHIQYEAVQPIPEMQPFGARSYISGTYPMYGVIQINGHLYQNMPSILTQLTSENPFDFPIEEGYLGGLNGYIDLSLPIGDNAVDGLGDILSFNIPLGEASAAISAVPVGGKILSKAFLNTRIQPDNSWWPGFIPAKPNGTLEVVGFIQQDGQFYLVLRGELGLQKSDNDQDLVNCVAELKADNESLELRGELNGPHDGWAVRAKIGGQQTDVSIEIPENLLETLSFSVKAELDQMVVTIDSLNGVLTEAERNLEIELSLQGLRDDIPKITAAARHKIEAGVASAKSRACSIVKGKIPKGFKLCSNPCPAINQWMDQLAHPYYQALESLDGAVSQTLTDEQARTALKKALQKLVDLESIRAQKTFSFKVGLARLKCRNVTSKTVKVTISVDIEVLAPADLDLLNQAVENIQYIAPAQGRIFDLGEYLANLPPREVVVNTQAEVASGAQNIPDLKKVGYTVSLNPRQFEFYAQLDEGLVKATFDPFNWKSIVALVTDQLLSK